MLRNGLYLVAQMSVRASGDEHLALWLGGFSNRVLSDYAWKSPESKGLHVAKDGIPPGQTEPLILGVIASAISGYAAIWWLLAYVRRHNYDVFVIYRLAVAAAILILIATGVRSATF